MLIHDSAIDSLPSLRATGHSPCCAAAFSAAALLLLQRPLLLLLLLLLLLHHNKTTTTNQICYTEKKDESKRNDTMANHVPKTRRQRVRALQNKRRKTEIRISKKVTTNANRRRERDGEWLGGTVKAATLRR